MTLGQIKEIDSIGNDYFLSELWQYPKEEPANIDKV